MLWTHQRLRLPELGLRHERTFGLHAKHRIVIHEAEGRLSDNLLDATAFRRDGSRSRPQLSIVLEGLACVRREGRASWLGPGDVVMMRSRAGLSARNDAAGAVFRCIDFEADDDVLSPRVEDGLVIEKLDRAALRRVIQLTRTMQDGPKEVATEAALALVALVRAAGFPLSLGCADALVETPPPWAERVAHALEDVLSRPSASPRLDDVSGLLGVSARQANRLIIAFNRRYAFSAAGWREMRARSSLLEAMYAMSNPRATTERVARSFGYQSPSAFCEAMQGAGLPSPGRIARIVRDLE